MTELSQQDDPILRLAIQKKGRLSDGCMDLLKRAGLSISHGRDKLYARVRELPIDLLLVRDDDIPSFVGDGASDIGIVGENVFEEEVMTSQEGPSEQGATAEIVMPLGFSRCKLCIATEKQGAYDTPSFLQGKRIATSYPGITQRWLREKGIDATTVMMNGAVEIAPRLNIADAICDIVSTGATLDAHGLKPVETIYQSQAVLIKSSKPLTPEKQDIYDRLLKRIKGVQESRDAKYIMMNAPRNAVDAITKVIPGEASPTILELAGQEDMVAIHSVCRESVFWETLEDLKNLGASGILVLPIEKMMS